MKRSDRSGFIRRVQERFFAFRMFSDVCLTRIVNNLVYSLLYVFTRVYRKRYKTYKWEFTRKKEEARTTTKEEQRLRHIKKAR